ncbi:hypothetical protein [Phytohabitans aurantiacus]|uniref:Peptidase inhibitor family I36 n=1 Tax=Phytohabitans aurantiacus TaxID=3016789 RepID=A0ABQ5R2E9_9ACTN|nr:hypothetical protein [Phytohabitans aurantiacus]GLI00959.1 hypothetical protein Pa4123_62350 [Phytohabitans aurantiacus]
MRSGRTIVGTVGVALAMLVLGLTGAPAQAAEADRAASVAGSAVAAISPGISPAAERVTYVSRYGFADYDCRSGRACLAVWDVNVNSWKVFDLFQCGSYRLSYWYDLGGMKNNQTGGAVVRTYGSGGGLILPYAPNGNGVYEVDWNPVWSVRPC